MSEFEPAGQVVVGCFQGGYRLGHSSPFHFWRITTRNATVAEAVFQRFGGSQAQRWSALGAEEIEVLTAVAAVEILLKDQHSLATRMIVKSRGRYGAQRPTELTPVQTSRIITDTQPQIDVHFRLPDEEALGVFRFRTQSWSMASDLAYDGTEAKLANLDAPVSAVLRLEPVSFVAKNGPKAGHNVVYTKPILELSAAV